MKKLLLMSATLLFPLLQAKSAHLVNNLNKAVYLRATIDGKEKKTTLEPGSQKGIEIDLDRMNVQQYRVSGTQHWIAMPRLFPGTYAFGSKGKHVLFQALYMLINERLSDNPDAYGNSVLVQWPMQKSFTRIDSGSRKAVAIPYTGKPITILYKAPALETARMAKHPQDDQEAVSARLSKQIALPLPGNYYLERADKSGHPTFTHESAHAYFAKNPNVILIRTYYPMFPINIETGNKHYVIDSDKYEGQPNSVTLVAKKFPFTLHYWSQDEGDGNKRAAEFKRGGLYHVLEQNDHPFIETARDK